MGIQVQPSSATSKPSTRDSSASSASRAERLRTVEDYIDLKIGEYLDAWRTEAESAVAGARVATESRSKGYFYLALAGNLIWAGTCLIDPAASVTAKIAVRAMSFGGAFIGSGSMEYYIADEPPSDNDAKNVVRQQLARSRGAIEEEFKKQLRVWATDLEGREFNLPVTVSHEEVLRAREGYVWSKMFSGIPFNKDRYEVIQAKLKGVIESALADFNRQFEAYNDAYIYEGEGLRRARGHYFRPSLRFWSDGAMFGPALPGFGPPPASKAGAIFS